MKLSDYINTHNLWEAIKAEKNFSFIDEISEDVLNMSLLVSSGEREVFKAFENVDSVYVAKFIVNHFGEKWLELEELFNLEFPVGTDKVKVTSETGGENKTESNSSEQINKTSGFNSEELVNEGGNNSSSSLNWEREGTKESESYEKSKRLSIEVLNSSVTQSILKTVTKDVTGFLTLSVY